MSESLQSRCLNPDHQDQQATFICTNSFCKEYKIYCFKCYKEGKHIPHYFETASISELPQYFQGKQEDSEEFIEAIQIQLDQVQELFVQLKQGLRQKYQINQSQLNSLSGDRLNQAFVEMIRWNDTKNSLQKAVGHSVTDLQTTLQNCFQNLDLQHLNYFRTLEEIEQMQQQEQSQIQNEAAQVQKEEVAQQQEVIHQVNIEHSQNVEEAPQQLNVGEKHQGEDNQQHEKLVHSEHEQVDQTQASGEKNLQQNQSEQTSQVHQAPENIPQNQKEDNQNGEPVQHENEY